MAAVTGPGDTTAAKDTKKEKAISPRNESVNGGMGVGGVRLEPQLRM
jgi:hypothetical protein